MLFDQCNDFPVLDYMHVLSMVGTREFLPLFPEEASSTRGKNIAQTGEDSNKSQLSSLKLTVCP